MYILFIISITETTTTTTTSTTSSTITSTTSTPTIIPASLSTFETNFTTKSKVTVNSPAQSSDDNDDLCSDCQCRCSSDSSDSKLSENSNSDSNSDSTESALFPTLGLYSFSTQTVRGKNLKKSVIL